MGPDPFYPFPPSQAQAGSFCLAGSLHSPGRAAQDCISPCSNRGAKVSRPRDYMCGDLIASNLLTKPHYFCLKSALHME